MPSSSAKDKPIGGNVKATRTLALAATLVTGAAGAQAALVDRGGGMIYDTVLKVTWLADTNYAQTSGFDADGLMDWATANIWANDLVYGGFSGWRLPTLNPADTSCNLTYEPGGGVPTQYYGSCTGGELNHLMVSDLGGKFLEDVRDTTGDTVEQIANLAMFLIPTTTVYWSGTGYAPDPNQSWAFSGWQSTQGTGHNIQR